VTYKSFCPGLLHSHIESHPENRVYIRRIRRIIQIPQNHKIHPRVPSKGLHISAANKKTVKLLPGGRIERFLDIIKLGFIFNMSKNVLKNRVSRKYTSAENICVNRSVRGIVMVIFICRADTDAEFWSNHVTDQGR